MRAVVVHDSDALGRSARRMVLGAGLECRGDDYIPFDSLERRLAAGDTAVIVVRIGKNQRQAVELAARAASLSQGPVFAVGKLDDPTLIGQVQAAGATHLESETAMQTEFETAVDSLSQSRQSARQRGRLISVFGPTAGSGATTLAVNLAGALASWYPQGVALAEMGRTVADIPLRLDVKADVGTNDICRRWEQLDSTSLEAGLARRDPGLRILAHNQADDEHYDDDPMHPAAVRRVGILMRSNFPYAVWKLDAQLDEECLESIRLSDCVLLVIRPDVLCVRRAQAARRLMESHGIDRAKLQLIVNRWGQPGQLTRRQIESTLDAKIFHQIADDPKVANRALNRGALFVEAGKASPATKAIAKLAKKLDQHFS